MLKQILFGIAHYKINNFLLSLERDNWQKEFERSQVLSGYENLTVSARGYIHGLVVSLGSHLDYARSQASQRCATHSVSTKEEQ